jgi:hypothetical protein
MAYPLTCVGGFNIPIRKGKFRITGVTALVDDQTVDSELIIVDDNTILETEETGHLFATEAAALASKKVIIPLKGDGSAYIPTLEWHPAEPIKTIYGISIYTSNLKANGLCIYIQ